MSHIPPLLSSPHNGTTGNVLVSIVESNKCLTTNMKIMHMLVEDRISDYVGRKKNRLVAKELCSDIILI
jgi:capsule polysaccharide export protein KpsC/LpsZ